MKKLLSAIFALALIGIVLNSCKKDDETILDNSITIEGTFTIGEKTFTNPTFNLGEPNLHIGYIRSGFNKSGNIIIAEPFDEFELGDGIMMNYTYYIYNDTVGESESDVNISVYLPVKSGGLFIHSGSLVTKITHVGDVGGYIEGHYEGLFYPNVKKEESYFVKGKFKVKRIEPIPMK